MASLPLFGSALILAVLLAATYTFAVSLVAGHNGRLRTLAAARFGAYGTVALIGVAVIVLAYAFVSHDFRLRYVAHYSDRSMPTHFLLTALWGGQDGSILWWLFLLSLYIGACVRWMGLRFVELQPYVLATLMTVVGFFAILMLFAANPFSTSLAGAKPDGEGLNPLLQNFYMIIHPPSLYVGFVGCSIPFAFAIAALVTGRLDTEWIRAARKFALFSWLFLAIGNTLGMLWAYEELGWGGYWAWDPVENAAFMPFLVMSAYLHSVMIQERRGMLKVWNVALMCATFFMTIFGTFLTRSGAIASVHSFAQSGIGTYFAWYLLLVFVASTSLILYRWPELRGLIVHPRIRLAALAAGWMTMAVFGPLLWLLLGREGSMPLSARVIGFSLGLGLTVFASTELVYRRMTRGLRKQIHHAEIESWASREFTFLLNNWGLLGFLGFVLIATTFPMISEALWDEKVTVGPPYYNAWVQPIGLIIYVLMGIGTLFGWRKTSEAALRKAFFAPTVATLIGMGLHLAFGKMLGFPAIVWSTPIYEGALGNALRAFNALTPLIGIAVAVFNAAVIVQEFVILIRARVKNKANDLPAWMHYTGIIPGLGHLVMLVTLAPAARRRYGGYVVHLGLVFMLIGFTGQSWNITTETTLAPGESITVDSYDLTYIGPRMQLDDEKRAVFGDLRVSRNGKELGTVSPAKFFFKKSPEMPTTEVAMLHSVRDDLYVVVGTMNPQTKTASFQLHVNPLVLLIWFGCLVLIAGSAVCMWPEPVPEESRVWRTARGLAGVAAATSIGVLIALMPTQGFAQSSSLHSGTVRIEDEHERDVFSNLRCMCGGCERLPLSTCACGEAEDERNLVRRQMESGMTKTDIMASYAAKHGSDALTVPPNTGINRSIYLLPLAAIAGGAVGLGMLVRRWRKSDTQPTQKTNEGVSDQYDDRLDEELSDLER